MDRSVSLFQFLKFKLIIPDQAYSLLSPYQMLWVTGRCQNSSQLNWRLENKKYEGSFKACNLGDSLKST